jgi:hypothetical protein
MGISTQTYDAREAIPVTKPEAFEGLNHSHSREAIKTSPIYTHVSYKDSKYSILLHGL